MMIVTVIAGYSSTRDKYSTSKSITNQYSIFDIRGHYSTARGNEADWFGTATH